jgi:hypothetical protein
MVALSLAMPALASATSADRTCELALGYNDPSIRNVGYPDQAAGYWLATYAAAPGSRLRIRGQYPHSRYISFNAYDPAGRPIDSLSDVELQPDLGSTNPFQPGADRTATERSYSASVEFGKRPAERARNTLYTGDGQSGTPNPTGTLLYRIYLPDSGTGDLGGVGLPELSLETDDGSSQRIELVDCRELTLQRAGLTDDLAAANGAPMRTGVTWPGYETPLWRRFVNLPMAYADLARDNPYADQTPLREALAPLPIATAGGSGGFFSNRDNDYIYAPVSRNWGQVLVLEGRLPSYPDTRSGAASMPAQTQVRYFSLCQNEIAATRWISCLADDQIAVDPDGNYRIVISTSEQRPQNARDECGNTWLPWGPSEEGVLIVRHMLPAPDFQNAIQRIPRETTDGEIKSILGPYYPTGHYVSDRAAFEAEGCG